VSPPFLGKIQEEASAALKAEASPMVLFFKHSKIKTQEETSSSGVY
jgi:hypothetical protein